MSSDGSIHMAPSTATAMPVLRRAAERARLAPSIHNTQPWRFELTENRLEIHADTTRQLCVLDARARQLTISCGCALFNARVAIAAAGYQPLVERLPDPDDPTLLARVSVGERRNLDMADLDPEIDRRHTNRRAFMGDEPPASFVRRLTVEAKAENVLLVPIVGAENRAEAARLSARADAMQREDPAYVAELMAWTTMDPRRLDGIQAMAVPYVHSWTERPSGAQVRSFDVLRMGWLPSAAAAAGADECRVVLCTADDSPAGWLRVGEALERVWLEIRRAGYWACPLNQVIEVYETHAELCRVLHLTQYPQIMLRIGQAPDVPTTPRRPASDVIVDATRTEEQP